MVFTFYIFILSGPWNFPHLMSYNSSSLDNLDSLNGFLACWIYQTGLCHSPESPTSHFLGSLSILFTSRLVLGFDLNVPLLPNIGLPLLPVTLDSLYSPLLSFTASTAVWHHTSVCLLFVPYFILNLQYQTYTRKSGVNNNHHNHNKIIITALLSGWMKETWT